MIVNENVLFYIWLAQSFPYGSIKPKQIVLNFNGDLQNFYNNLDENVKKFDLTPKRINILKKKKPSDFKNIVNLCEKLKIKIVCFHDKNYPKKLRNIDSSPVVLYYVGNLSAADKPSVAIVGTRKATAYGMRTANKIARELACCDITIVSGCAEGIDSSAHYGTVDVHKNTIAVLGTSIERPYPLGSSRLKHQIILNGGLILSEYAPETEVHPWLFPIRNRLIVSLSDCVVVVESPEKSGAMITANIACNFGKEVFCVPPSDIFSHKNDGIKKCLKDGANLLLDVSDILNSFKFSDYFITKQNILKNQTTIAGQSNKQLQIQSNDKALNVPERLRPLFDLIDADFELDSAAKNLNMPINQILEMLTELEIIGAIQKCGICYKKF